jgi:hypothetical protein
MKTQTLKNKTEKLHEKLLDELTYPQLEKLEGRVEKTQELLESKKAELESQMEKLENELKELRGVKHALSRVSEGAWEQKQLLKQLTKEAGVPLRSNKRVLTKAEAELRGDD